MIRIGIGFDMHPLETGYPLVLGGVKIDYSHGLVGHSDADVLTHAVIDALLGGGALGDIGDYFPSDNPEYRGISSMLLLQETAGVLKEANLRVVNIDATIIAENPRLSTFRDAMRENIADALSIETNCVNVKATTTEGLDSIGNGQGISAQAVASLEQA
jgi:2-C-methyl-D-erythritol 2,4-cyclodiphosphate synthase